MKRVLNLNEPGAKLLSVAVALGVLMPVLLFACLPLLQLFGLNADAIWMSIWIFVTGGGVLAAVLLVLIVVEQIQDHLIDMAYQRNRGQKLRLTETYFECQFCGNRKVRAEDRQCLICGRKLS